MLYQRYVFFKPKQNHPFPSDFKIINWIKSNFKTGNFNDLISKSIIQDEFFQKFNIQTNQSHFAVTRLGELIKNSFPRVEQAKPGTAAHGYRAPCYRYLKSI